MGYVSLNKSSVVKDQVPAEQVSTSDGLDFINYVLDGIFLLGGLILAPFTAGASLGATIASETALAAGNAVIDAGIDIARDKGSEAPYEFLGVALAPLGVGTGKFLGGFRNAAKVFEKEGIKLSYGSTGKISVKSKDVFSFGAGISFFTKDTKIRDVIKQVKEEYIKSKEDIIKFGYAESALNELNRLDSIASKLGNEIFDVENRLKQLAAKGIEKITKRSVFRRIGELFFEYLLTLRKLSKVLQNPLGEGLGLTLHELRRSEIIYKWLGIKGQKKIQTITHFWDKKWVAMQKRFFKGRTSLLNVIDKIKMKYFNLQPMDSDWILGYRIVYKAKNIVLSETTNLLGDLQIVFKSAKTQHFGEILGASRAEPFGKRMVTINNITNKEFDEFVNAEDPGSYYYKNFAKADSHGNYHRRASIRSALLRQIVDVLPGFSFIADTAAEAAVITRFFNHPKFRYNLTGSKLGTRLIDEATRGIFGRHYVGQLARIVVGQSFGFQGHKLTKSLAQAAGLNITRTSVVPNQLKGSYKAYKVNRAAFRKVKEIKL